MKEEEIEVKEKVTQIVKDYFGYASKPALLTCDEVYVCENPYTRIGKINFIKSILQQEIDYRQNIINKITNIVTEAQETLDIEKVDSFIKEAELDEFLKDKVFK